MVNTKKFSEFAAGSLTTTTKKMAGISNVSGGENIIVDFTTEWTTATRPAPPYDGLLGYNTDLKQYEYYDSSLVDWVQLADNAVFVNAKFILQQPYASLPAAQALSALSTGILKSTTTSGVLSISAPLTSIDGLTTSADKMIYTTASNVYAVTDLTAFARTLLDDASAAAMRTTLGLGQAAVKDVTDNTKANVASVTGAFVVNHVLLAADANGTVKDGGSPAGMGTVLEVDTGTGLTGGPITTTGTISLDVPVSLANGGTNASLIASAGAVAYSTASALALSAVGSSGQLFQSTGTTAPGWTTATYPSTAGTANNVISSDGTNFASSTLTSIIDAAIGSTQGDLLYRNATVWTVLAPGTAGQLLATGGAAANPSWTTSTFPTTGGPAGNILISNGTNYIASTSLWPNTVGANGKFLISDGTSNGYSTSTIPSSAGATANKVLLSDGTNYVLSTPTFPNASATAGKLIISDGTNWIASTSLWPNTVGAAGKIVRSDGTTNAYSTATYPDTATGTGTMLRADGTNWVASTATFADTYGASTLLYSNGANTVTGLATANSASLVTSSAGVPVWSSTMTNGQVIIGSTGATPTAATLTPGTGISITNAAGSITIDATGIGMAWSTIAGTTQAAAVNNGYVVGNAGQTTITLPATASVGSSVTVKGLGAGGWILAANTGQTIKIGTSSTSSAGSLTSAAASDHITVTCIVANTTWSMDYTNSTGLTVA